MSEINHISADAMTYFEAMGRRGEDAFLAIREAGLMAALRRLSERNPDDADLAGLDSEEIAVGIYAARMVHAAHRREIIMRGCGI